MDARIKHVSDRYKEIYQGEFCIIKMFLDDEDFWNIRTMTEDLTFSSFFSAMAWVNEKGLVF